MSTAQKAEKKAKERKTLTISGKSWHGRIYKYWYKHPESKSWRWDTDDYVASKRENLCHFLRVLFVWAPLLFLGYARPKKHLTWMRPWMPLVAGAIIASLTLGFMYALNGTIQVLLTIGGIFLFCCALVGAAYAKDEWWEKREKKGDGFATVIKETVKAKKARICPFIERVDMD